MPNSEIDISVIESKLKDKVQIQLGRLGTAAINTSNGLHRDVLKVMLEVDEKTGVTAITGLDLGANIGLLYHIHTAKDFFGICTEVPKENPKIQTIIDIIPGAALHELEVADLLGVVFEGNPSPRHFLFSEYWPQGVYPLRKDVKANEIKLNPASVEENKPPETGRLVKLIIGPHPSIAGTRKILRNS